MAKTFPTMTSKPSANNPYLYLYNNSNNNGLSWCINGKPTDPVCNVLCNCVGWACARFNHIYNLLTGYSGIKYPRLCCNAENFIEVAKEYGLKVGMKPEPGAIMVWQRGATLSSGDGAGHVAVVEEVYSDNSLKTSESGYGNFDFANRMRTNDNGRWGISDKYSFRGFIYNPAVEEDEPPKPIEPPKPEPIPEDKLGTVTIRTVEGDRDIKLTTSDVKLSDYLLKLADELKNRGF